MQSWKPWEGRDDIKTVLGMCKGNQTECMKVNTKHLLWEVLKSNSKYNHHTNWHPCQEKQPQLNLQMSGIAHKS